MTQDYSAPNIKKISYNKTALLLLCSIFKRIGSKILLSNFTGFINFNV